MTVSRKKKAGYRLYGILYSAFRLLPVKTNNVYFIMTHDSSPEGNCGVMKTYFESLSCDTANDVSRRPPCHRQSRRKAQSNYICRTLTRRDTRHISFIFRSAYELAVSRYVFMDNAFLPLAYLKLRKETTLVQLWHGTGTVKRFGQSTTTGELRELEARCARNISFVTVSSDATRRLYAECFGVPESKVIVTGLPRSDIFFDKNFAADARARFEAEYPLIKGRKLILYAPTFRDNDKDCSSQLRVVQELIDAAAHLPDFCLGLRLHPFVADTAKHIDSPSVIDLSKYEGLNTILGAADILITDYSSIIFEYALLKRPMIFYAYDLNDFESAGRGFYKDYRSYVPGPVVTDVSGIIDALSKTDRYDFSLSDSFVTESFAYTDGRSAERIKHRIG